MTFVVGEIPVAVDEVETGAREAVDGEPARIGLLFEDEQQRLAARSRNGLVALEGNFISIAGCLISIAGSLISLVEGTCPRLFGAGPFRQDEVAVDRVSAHGIWVRSA